MQKFLVIVFVLLGLFIQKGFSQDFVVTVSDSLAIIEGDEYLIHSVEPRQTLFSIASVYKVKLSRIAFDNPGVLNGLQKGQLLKILKSAQGETNPVEVSDEKLELDGQYILYKVPRRQTLYSIAKEYNTSVAAIIDANPELVDGLKVRTTIRIPVPMILGEKETDKERMVGLPNIVQKAVVLEQLTVLRMGEPTHITLMLPLYLDLNDTINAADNPEVEEEIYGKSEIALHFYEGFLMAIDTLNQLGYKVKVKVIDTENRPWKIRKLVEQGALKNTDLIIGPLYSKVFDEVSGYAYDNCIPMVSPTIKDQGILANNDYVFKIIPSPASLAYDLGRYLSQSDSTANMVLHYGTPDEQKLLLSFRQGLESMGEIPFVFPAFDIYKAGSDSIRNRLSLSGRNNLVILSNNQVKLASLLRKLMGWSEEAYIVAFAPGNWQRFKNLEIDHFDQLRIHRPAEFHADYNQLEVQQFVQQFRLRYQGEPNTFAFRGYDVAMHFVKNINGIKNSGPEYMLAVEETGLQSAFGWKQLEDGGFENARSRIVDYTGLQLKLATD
jgi:ABC-type branched-subunit amino acid transport system substrate-binding protein/LysM repeat protein